MTVIFNWGPLKPKLNNIWGVDILFKYVERLVEKNYRHKAKNLAQNFLVTYWCLVCMDSVPLKCFEVDSMIVNVYTFILEIVLKHSRK